MNRRITLMFFGASVVAVGIYFFRIVQPFLLPLLMAGTLALLIQPLFARIVIFFRGFRRIAAMVVSVAVVFLVVLPILLALGFATQELIKYGGAVVDEVQKTGDGELEAAVASLRTKLSKQDFERLYDELLDGNGVNVDGFRYNGSEVTDLIERIGKFSPDDVEKQVRVESGAAYLDLESIPVLGRLEKWITPYVSRADIEDLRSSGLSMARALLADVYEKTAGLLSNLVSFVIGFAVMMLAFYYFLAEGPAMTKELEGLLPIEPEDEVAVVKQFETICRGVVLGTLVAAIAQAVLLGGALALLGIPGVWLLTCLTVVLAAIPFVGAGGIYVPVTGYLLWQERYGAAIFLLLYGTLLVSTMDNLIRAHMIHGTSRLHPLLALISALGALKLVGLWGIFVGPVVAGIFYALLKILQQKLNRIERQSVVAEV